MKRVYNKTDEGGGGGPDKSDNTQGAGGDNTNGGGADGGDGPVELEMEVFDDEGGDGGAAAAAAAKSGTGFNFNSLKGVFGDDEDITDEVVFTGKVKKIKEEQDNLRILALGRQAIDEDKEILNFRSLLGQNDDTLAYLSTVQDYMDAGKPKNVAQELAQKDIEDIKAGEKGDKEIAKLANNTRKFLRSSISDKEKSITDSIKTAKGAVDFRTRDEKVILNAKGEVAKLNSFLGFKLPDGHKAKLVKEAQEFVGSKEEAEAWSNAQTRAEIAMFLKHKKQWQKNVESRGPGARKKLLEGAIKDLKVGQGKNLNINAGRNKGQGNGSLMKDPGSFLGGPKK